MGWTAGPEVRGKTADGGIQPGPRGIYSFTHMTVNIGVVTSDALVLSCDSIASVTEPLLSPFGFLERDADGELKRDAEGRFTAKFDFQDLQQRVTSYWGGVTKMFQIHPDPSPVVAVTAGTARLLDRSIASHAGEFFREHKQRWGTLDDTEDRLVDVEPICRAFLQLMRDRYMCHYKESSLPEELWRGPEFLVGGFGQNDAFPSIYRVSVQNDSITCDFADGKCGISWNGQSDAIERFIKGYDRNVRLHIDEVLEKHEQKTQSYVTKLVNNILDRLAKELPDGIQINVPLIENDKLDWERHALPIGYSNLPLQEAVNFASAMVMVQASHSRFAAGIATVGGRTHIGVITKSKGFRTVNEPEITHKLTGLSDDI